MAATSVPTEISPAGPAPFQAFFADSEEMGDPVDDGDLDLPLQLGDGLAHLLQGLLEDVDRVGMERAAGRRKSAPGRDAPSVEARGAARREDSPSRRASPASAASSR